MTTEFFFHLVHVNVTLFLNLQPRLMKHCCELLWITLYYLIKNNLFEIEQATQVNHNNNNNRFLIHSFYSHQQHLLTHKNIFPSTSHLKNSLFIPSPLQSHPIHAYMHTYYTHHGSIILPSKRSLRVRAALVRYISARFSTATASILLLAWYGATAREARAHARARANNAPCVTLCRHQPPRENDDAARAR